MAELIKLEEPELIFGHNQALEDPRDGLSLFGPLKENSPFGINYGLIGTEAGINRFYRWLKTTKSLLAHNEVSKRILWIPFPGFEEIFRIPFADEAITTKIVDAEILKQILKDDDAFQRVYKAVDLFEEPIREFYKRADEGINIWFAISPESVFKECRPKSTIDDPLKIVSRDAIKKRKEIAKLTRGGQEFIFNGQEQDYFAYNFDNDFRRQLKARLILNNIKDPVQIIRESTLTQQDFLDKWGNPERDLEPDSQVAWNLLSAIFYKAGGKPWKLKGIREGVCYLGMVFKKLEGETDKRSACCAAQMFLDSGDGVVFKGAVGPWKSPEGEDYHLDYNAAKEIIHRAVAAYKDLFGNNTNPKEIFLHGRTYLNEEEWRGFSNIAQSGIKIVGIRIRQGNFKLFRSGRFPVLREMALIENYKKGYLWSTGFIPKLKTYPYQGIPYPLEIDICKGDSDLLTIMKDILALTKLNYNSCHFADAVPITLQFAQKIGDILTAGPIEKDTAPLPFKFYI